jgi:hypothetical protein
MGTSHAGQVHEVTHRTIAIGLIADPELPAEIAEDLADKLPKLLAAQVDSDVQWRVMFRHEPLPVRQRPKALIGAIHQILKREHWDLAICITDLPLQVDGSPVVAEASPDQGIGLISLPALGPARERERARDAIVRLIGELLAGRNDLGRDQGPTFADTPPHLDVRPQRSAVGVRFVAPAASGTVRLLGGMIRANRPWRFVLGLLSALTAAVATAAIANLNSTIWRVADAQDAPHLLLLTVASLAGMTIWLIVVHKLWRRPSEHMSRQQAALFNVTTTVTLLIGVGTLYVGLFAFNLIGGVFVVAARPLSSTLGHPAGVVTHLRLAWFVSSVATVGGALGSGLESNAAVRAAAYRYQAEQTDD